MQPQNTIPWRLLISGRFVLVQAYSRMAERHLLLAIVAVSMTGTFIISLLTCDDSA